MATAPNMNGTTGNRYRVLVDDRARPRGPGLGGTAAGRRRRSPPVRCGPGAPAGRGRRNTPRATTTVPQSTTASSAGCHRHQPVAGVHPADRPLVSERVLQHVGDDLEVIGLKDAAVVVVGELLGAGNNTFKPHLKSDKAPRPAPHRRPRSGRGGERCFARRRPGQRGWADR